MPRRNPVLYPWNEDWGKCDLDAMMEASKRWEQLWSELLDSVGARYQITYGLLERSDVESCDPEECIVTRLPARFQAKINSCIPEGVDLSDEGDRILEASGLGEYLFYDGWESGDCESDDPREWPSSFWYEHDHSSRERLYTRGSFDAAAYDAQKLKAKLLR